MKLLPQHQGLGFLFYIMKALFSLRLHAVRSTHFSEFLSVPPKNTWAGLGPWVLVRRWGAESTLPRARTHPAGPESHLPGLAGRRQPLGGGGDGALAWMPRRHFCQDTFFLQQHLRQGSLFWGAWTHSPLKNGDYSQGKVKKNKQHKTNLLAPWTTGSVFIRVALVFFTHEKPAQQLFSP